MKEQWFQKMDQYLKGAMSREERLQFESELAINRELSAEFNIFKTVEEEMRNEVKNSEVSQSIKRSVADMFEAFLPGEVKNIREIKRPSYKVRYSSIASIAASVIIFLVTYLFFFRPASDVRQLAATYINENLVELPFSMGSSNDIVEQGKLAFNKKDYAGALRLFINAYKTDSANMDAKKYTGVVYLITKDYDKAIKEFGELAEVKGLKYNWGHFYKAVALLNRNEAGDKEVAKQELNKVIKEDHTQGEEEARKWLNKLGK